MKPHSPVTSHDEHVGHAIAERAKAVADRVSHLTPEGIAELVRTQPLVAFAGAGAAGMLLGGLFFPRIGRLAFLVVAGFVANGLLQRQRDLDIEEVVTRAPARKRAHA
jgi:hypothetical protein